MAGSKTHTWISLWFLITAPIIFWDVSSSPFPFHDEYAACYETYILMTFLRYYHTGRLLFDEVRRLISEFQFQLIVFIYYHRPRSFKGGDLHWIWNPYALYQEVDLVYGVDAYYRGDGFTNAQGMLNEPHSPRLILKPNILYVQPS